MIWNHGTLVRIQLSSLSGSIEVSTLDPWSSIEGSNPSLTIGIRSEVVSLLSYTQTFAGSIPAGCISSRSVVWSNHRRLSTSWHEFKSHREYGTRSTVAVRLSDKQEIAGSSPAGCISDDSLAGQSAGLLTRKPWVRTHRECWQSPTIIALNYQKSHPNHHLFKHKA